MNKRGQELSIGTLILIILGIVVLVVIVIGLTTGTDFLFGLFEKGPGSSLEIVAQGCGVAAEAGLYIDYCKEFKEVEINGVEQYVNCEFPDIEAVIDGDLVCSSKKGFELAETAKAFCKGKDIDTLVNGAACSTYNTEEP